MNGHGDSRNLGDAPCLFWMGSGFCFWGEGRADSSPQGVTAGKIFPSTLPLQPYAPSSSPAKPGRP